MYKVRDALLKRKINVSGLHVFNKTAGQRQKYIFPRFLQFGLKIELQFLFKADKSLLMQ